MGDLRGVMRKIIQVFLIPGFLFSLFAVVPSMGHAAEVTKIIISVDAPTLSDLPLHIAAEKQFFRSERLEILQVLVRSGPTAVQALVSGSTQFSTAFGSGTRAAMVGVPIKGILAFNDKPNFSLYARKESGILSGRDLKGKKIAVTGLGSTTDFLARFMLKHYNLDPDKDALIVATGGENVFPALTSGAVDAAILWPPTFAMAEKLGMVKIQHLRDVILMPGSGIVAPDRLINENPALIKTFLRATLKGFKYIHDPKNREEIVAHMMKSFKLEKDVAESNYSFLLSNLSQDGRVSRKSVENFIEMTRQRVKTSESSEQLIKKMYAFHLLEEVLKGN